MNLLLLDLSELNSSVEGGGLLAGEGILGVVASEGLLVKDGGVTAGERPLGVLNDLALVVLNGQADVEDLTSVVDIGVVAIGLSLASEALRDGVGEDVLDGVGELVAASALGHGHGVVAHGADDSEGGESVGLEESHFIRLGLRGCGGGEEGDKGDGFRWKRDERKKWV